MAIHPVPKDHNRVSPYLLSPQAPAMLEFLAQSLGARQLARHDGPDGRIVHAEVRLGDSVIMVSQTEPDLPMVHIYVDDVDAAYQRALAAGAESLREPTTQPYGDRTAGVRAFGHQWWLATHVEDVSPEELQRRMRAT